MTRQRQVRLALGFLVVMASASATHAQNAPPHPKWFVTGSVLGSNDRPIRFEDYGTFFGGPTWTPTAGVGVGAFLAERWSLQAEVDVPRGAETEYFTWDPQLPPLRMINWRRQETTRRHVTAAGLLGFHPLRSGRVRPVILVGATVAHLLAEETYQVLSYAGSPWQTVDRFTASATHVGVIAGLDVETRVTATFGVVAQAGGSIVPGGNNTESGADKGGTGICRLGVGVRWMF